MGRVLVRRLLTPLFTSYAWETKSSNTGFTPRDGAMLERVGDKHYLFGGWNSEVTAGAPFDGGENTTNQILSSVDLATWTLAKAHDLSPPTSGPGARPKRRHWPGLFKHRHGGVEYVYMLGGDHESKTDPEFSGAPSNGYQGDGWRTPNPGGDWERLFTSNGSPVAGRMLAVWGESPDALWVFGGQTGILGEATSTLFNDLQRSTDGGFTWSMIWPQNPSAPGRPSPRGIINKMVYWRGRMWLPGGGTYDTADRPTRQFFKEVWSFDPKNPSDVRKHATPPWPGVQYHSVEVLNDRLFVFGGFGGYSAINTRGAWSTADGERWDRHETPPWVPSHADATCVSGNTLVHVVGNGGIAEGVMRCHALTATPEYVETEVPAPIGVWKASNAVLSGSNIVSIPDANGGAVSLVPPTVGDATYTASSAALGGVPAAVSDGGAFLKTSAPVDLSTYTIFIVSKPAASAGLFYHAYALLTGPTRYAYHAQSRTAANLVTLSMDVLRGGVNTVGATTNVPHEDDRRAIYVLHYDGTAAGSGVFFEDARVLPDTGALTGNAGTGAFSATLHFYSDNTGAGSKAVEVAEIHMYRALTKAERQAVVRKLRAAHPYPITT